MARRYADVEPKPVAELVPGDEVVTRRRAEVVTRIVTDAGGTVSVTWDDGTVQTFDLADEPALEVVVRKDA